MSIENVHSYCTFDNTVNFICNALLCVCALYGCKGKFDCVFVFVFLSLSVCVYVCVCTYVCVCLCVGVFVCVCVGVCGSVSCARVCVLVCVSTR